MKAGVFMNPNSFKSNYFESFWDKTYKAYNNYQISECERVRLNNLYNSGKRIDARSQLTGYCKRIHKVKSSAKY